MSKPVLYRCPSPDFLSCHCGRVAKSLKKAGVEFENRKVPFSKKKRPEIEELTGQSRVPVLVDGDEIIHDSKRIREYVEHTWGTR
jgi:glutathione S-transferase